MERARQSLLAALAVLVVGAAFAASAISAPAAPWAKLGAEDRGSYRWSVKAGLGAASQGPCLLVAASWRSGPLEYHRSTYRECASAPSLRRSEPPLIAVGAQPRTGAPVRMTAVGMIFAPAARSVRITFAGGRTETIRLRKFDPAQTGDLELGRFRYAAFAVHGTWCAERLVSLSASGVVLWDSGADDYACGSSADPHFAARGR